LERLHKIFFQSAFSDEISLSTISAGLDLTTYETINIVKDLIQSSVIEWNPFCCERCGKEISEPLSQCGICKQDVTESWTFNLDGNIPDRDQEAFLKFSNGRSDSERFAARLNDQGYMYYLLLDLAESENIQEQDSLQYDKFLERIRVLMERGAMSQASDAVLCLGETGDCLKLAFLSVDDTKTVLESFAKLIRAESWGKGFPLLEAVEAKYFPRYDGIMGKIKISPRRKEELKNIFCITLNGAVDFNDYELTKLFRFDSEIKTRKEIFDGNTVLSVWVQDQMFKDMGWDEIPSIDVTAPSHNKDKKDTFGLLAYTGLDNDPTAIENPKEFKKEK
jgi:hypothetical protein